MLSAIMSALGLDPCVSVWCYHFQSLLDIRIHSVNPYSVVFYFPPLDYIFQCNVAHTLHHCVNKDYYTFIPFHHVIPGNLELDQMRYDQLMHTNFFNHELGGKNLKSMKTSGAYIKE